MKRTFVEPLINIIGKSYHGKPGGIWFVILILLIWTLFKLSDIYYIIKGEARVSIIISFFIIVTINTISLVGLWKRNNRILSLTRFWFMTAYIVSVIILPQYTHPDERWGAVFMMGLIMLPVLIGWFILRSFFIVNYFSGNNE